MSKKLVFLMFLAIILTGLSIAPTNVHKVEAQLGTIYIRADGSIDPPTANITSSSNVTYTFTADINASLVVEKNNIVVDGANHTVQGTSGAGISLSGRSNVTIKNMAIGGFYEGIRLDSYSSNNTISGNSMTYNLYGVFLSFCNNTRISGNNIGNSWVGIGLFDSTQTLLSENNITASTWQGVRIVRSPNSFLHGNSLDGNDYGFDVSGSELSHYLHSIDTSNLVDGKPVYYLVSQHDRTISPSSHPEVGFLALINSTNLIVEGLTLTKNAKGTLIAYTNNTKIKNSNVTNNADGIFFQFSSNNTISGNEITANDRGIWLEASSNNTISGNNIRDDEYGILLTSSSNNNLYGNNMTKSAIGLDDNSSNNTISGNNIIETSYRGVYLQYSSNNTISGNNITNKSRGIWLYDSSNNVISGNNIRNNEYGIYIYESSNNKFHHNNIVDNTQQVCVETSGYPNIWDDGYPSGGNYWSNHTGVDSDPDGMGDTPHVIDANNTDNYPLMSMFSDFLVTHQEETYHLATVCNSIISEFQFNDIAKTISFNVTGPDYTLGFCRLTVPNIIIQDLWQGNYEALVDGEEPIMMNNWTDGTYTYIYFMYLHSEHKVEIVPEFPSWTSILLILIVLTVATAIYKRRLLKTHTLHLSSNSSFHR